MKTVKILLLVVLVLSGHRPTASANNSPTWSIDVGVRWFKHSSEGGPNEIGLNPVFSRWESINQNISAFSVSDYSPLEPLYFNINFGIDVLVRLKTFFMLKLGYDYSNPFGIGGKGQISYTDSVTGVVNEESKEFSYTIHQVNLFFGPSLPVSKGRAEIYLALAPMAPTWVSYNEKYSHTQDGSEVEKYDRTFSGFFGSCRALIGIQIRVLDDLKLGAEMIFTVLNYMKLTSGDLEDYSFRFPSFKWNFTIRYELL